MYVKYNYNVFMKNISDQLLMNIDKLWGHLLLIKPQNICLWNIYMW
jgi:hypothetical protein